MWGKVCDSDPDFWGADAGLKPGRDAGNPLVEIGQVLKSNRP